jgi:hypothetical protein
MRLSGDWHVKHIRDGEVLDEFDAHNSLTRRGAFDVFQRFLAMRGYNGGFTPGSFIPNLEGGEISDFFSMFGWAPMFIEHEGDGVLNNGGDFDSGRGLHRDDRVEYFQRNTGNPTVPPQNDNREWEGDLHQILTDGPLPTGSTTGLEWTHYNNGIPIPIGVGSIPRNITSLEWQHTYRAGGNRSYRGIWMYQRRNQGGFSDQAMQCVTSSALFPARLDMRKFDFLELTYKMSYTATVAT